MRCICRETSPQDRQFWRRWILSHLSDRKERISLAEDNSSEQPWPLRAFGTQGKRGCFQTSKTIRVSCSFTWREQTVSYKKIFLSIITCKKEKKTNCYYFWVRFLFWLVPMQNLYLIRASSKKVLRGNGTITCPRSVVPVLNYLAIKCLSLVLNLNFSNFSFQTLHPFLLDSKAMWNPGESML